LGAISIFGSIAPYFTTVIKPVTPSTPIPPPPGPINPTLPSSPSGSTGGTLTGNTPPPVSPTAPVTPVAANPIGTGLGPFMEDPYDFTDEGEPIYPEFQEGYYPDENPIEEPPYEPVIEESEGDDFN
jgi:hypothetical protein